MSQRRAKRPAPDEGVTTVSEDPQDAIVIEPEPEPVAPYEALVVDPPEEAAEPDPQQPVGEEPVPDGFVRVVYRGYPDGALTLREYKFRSGEPVNVPSDVAEELLTMPFEDFERI